MDLFGRPYNLYGTEIIPYREIYSNGKYSTSYAPRYDLSDYFDPEEISKYRTF